MPMRHVLPLCMLVFALLLPAICHGAQPATRLKGPPLGERWFTISMNDERVGFGHTTVKALADGYEICSEGSVKLRVMTTSRESSSRERFQVGKDLSLKSFQVEQTIDGKGMKLQGTVEGKAVKVVVDANGSSKKKTLKFKGKLLPPPALNFYPPMQGAVADKKYTVLMLDAEAVKVKDVEMTVIGRETLPDGVESLHMQNDLYPFVDNDIWIDPTGNTLKESVRDGMILTVAEDPKTVKQFIADAALARREMMLAFSLVRVEPPLQDPAKLKTMTAVFSGIPPEFPLFQGPGQVATRLADGSVQFRITPAPEVKEGAGNLDIAPYLTGNVDKEVAAKAQEIAGNEHDRRKVAERLIRWLGTEVKVTTGDRLSPLETLKRGEGNALSHAMLYLAMARILGIPTRMVSGLVYVKDKGFLYHSWAESELGGWLAVDPTSGQLPADASHIKLIEGDGPEELALLGGIVGRLKGTITERQY